MTQSNHKLESWLRLLALFAVAGFIEAVFWGQIIAFTPLYLPHLGVPIAQIPLWTGTITALSFGVGIPFLPFWGALADRFSRKPVIVRSFVAHLIVGVVALLAGNIWVFMLGRAFSAFALGNSGLMMTTLSERTPKERLGLAFSIMNSAPPMGAFLGPLLGGPVVDQWGFPALLAIDSALMIGVILALLFGYQDNFVGTDRGPLLKMAFDSVGIILRSPRLRSLFPALFLLFAGWMLAFTYLPIVIMSIYRGSDPGTAVGIVLGAGGSATLVLGPVIGALADRYGHWRTLFVGAFIAVLLWPLPAFVSGLQGFTMAWMLLNGVLSAIFALSFSVLSSSADPDVRGRVMTFAYLPVNVGGLVGPMLGSVVVQAGMLTIFPVAAAITALGLGALYVAYLQPTRMPSESQIKKLYQAG